MTWGAERDKQRQVTTARPLVFGILPFMTPVAIFTRFAPLRDYLSQQIQMSMFLETSPNFSAHLSRISQRRYDLLVTAPHFVPLAIDTTYYHVVAKSLDNIATCIVVKPNSAIQELSDLSGKSIAIPPETAMVTMVGREMFRDAGLIGEKTPQYMSFLTHNAAYEALTGQQIFAAVVSSNVLTTVSTTDYRRLACRDSFSSLGVLISTELPPLLQQQLTTAFLEIDKNPQGLTVLKTMKYTGFKVSENADFQAMRPYADRLQELELMSTPSP
ncbi:ABC-type phosphate/phosphonate transport system, periplasmic component [Beggiatoa alba B18LD]|uniref:ABC-type phosphate/phosphonate transport system, periplasmic component n=2 Tax=Beggiatoa alba TaxID=1022 RepID=I3CIY9_9GAMM|nr:ABC-type phosphate/phosphonate transport system, periplasmic component [Beggiatoa alba B18LD]